MRCKSFQNMPHFHHAHLMNTLFLWFWDEMWATNTVGMCVTWLSVMNVGCSRPINEEINCCLPLVLMENRNKSFLFAGEQDESICKTYITQIKNLRLQVEDCESRTVARIRQPVDKDPLRDCMQKTADQKVRDKTLVLHILSS